MLLPIKQPLALQLAAICARCLLTLSHSSQQWLCSFPIILLQLNTDDLKKPDWAGRLPNRSWNRHSAYLSSLRDTRHGH